MASAASRLHNDILLDIFHIIVQVTFACDNTSDNGTAGSLLILPISHVCRSWRILTLASPCLWSFLQITATTHNDMLDAFLSRSQAVILSIRFSGWKVNEELFEMARTLSEKHMGRMGNLCIKDLWTQNTVKILAFFEDKHAPNLYALTVEAGPNGDVVPLFDGCMPVLRRLRMKMVILRWLPLKDMVVLEIVGEAYMPAKEDLLWTLRHSPALEELHLSLGEESPQDAVTSSLHIADDVVHLPRLQNLQLGSFRSNDDVLFFLSRLDFPTSASVSVSLYGPPPEHAYLGDICPSIRDIQARIVEGSLRFDFLYTVYNVILRSLDGTFNMEWERGLLLQANSDAHMRNALNCVSLPALQCLKIYANNYSPPKEEWVDLFRRIPTILRLEVDFRSELFSSGWSQSGPAFFDALGEHGVDGKLVCPHLTQLIIVRDTSDGVAQGEAWEALRRTLLGRAQEGAPQLESLDFIKGEGDQELTLPEDYVPVDRLAGLAGRIIVQPAQDESE